MIMVASLTLVSEWLCLSDSRAVAGLAATPVTPYYSRNPFDSEAIWEIAESE